MIQVLFDENLEKTRRETCRASLCNRSIGDDALWICAFLNHQQTRVFQLFWRGCMSVYWVLDGIEASALPAALLTDYD